MRIPTPSDVLIVGVSSASLAFATLLAKGGLNVLVIDKAESQTNENQKLLNLSDYSVKILKQCGYTLDEKTTEQDFEAQSLSLLAHSLCCAIWGTELIQSIGRDHQLLQDGKTQAHDSNFVFTLADLEISQTNTEANFRKVFVLAWRVVAVQLKKMHPFILHSLEVEKTIIAEFYQDKKDQGFISRWISKLGPPKSEDLKLTDSPINLHLSQQRVLEAGQLLPNLNFYDEKLKQESSLYQWCSYQYFSLLVVGTVDAQHVYNIAKWVQLNFGIKLFYLPYSEANDLVFKELNIKAMERRTLITRPDRYICMINDTVETDIIDNYLRNVLMMNSDTEQKDSKN